MLNELSREEVSLSCDPPIIKRGRAFTSEEIDLLRELCIKHYEDGRTRISIEFSQTIGWRQPNGWLKDRACRDVMKSLEEDGLISLPPPKVKINNNFSYKRKFSKASFSELDDKDIIDIEFRKITTHQVKGTKEELLWNFLVDEYHYLGYRPLVGRSLKYLFKIDSKVVAAAGFSDPAWRINARDKWLQRVGLDASTARAVGINNSRFLILPWVKVPNLASYVLMSAISAVKKDWECYYEVTPMYVETFVDPSRFLGTCYKAANWHQIGSSKGFKKNGRSHENVNQPKQLFIYPLDKKIRKLTFKIIG